MQTITCPDCEKVIQQGTEITDRQKTIAINQLANHLFTIHILPWLEGVLRDAAQR